MFGGIARLTTVPVYLNVAQVYRQYHPKTLAPEATFVATGVKEEGKVNIEMY